MAIDAECDGDFNRALQLWEQVNLLATKPDDRRRALNKVRDLTSRANPIAKPIVPPTSEVPLFKGDLGGSGTEAKSEESEGAIEFPTPRYSRLRDLLKNQRWKDADQVTLKIMLNISNRRLQGWLDADSLSDFPSRDLEVIDRLWVTASAGRFGFSVQKRIWEQCGRPMAFTPNWKKCLNSFGWYKSDEPLRYKDLKFSITDSPHGELPGMSDSNDAPGSFTTTKTPFGSFGGGSIELWCLFARDDLRSIPKIPGE